MLLTRDAILLAPDRVTEDVHVPEWGGTVRVRGLSGAERDRFEASVTGTKAARKGESRDLRLDNLRARFLALSIVDDTGELMFGDRDIKALGEKAAAPIQRIYDVARRLSGLTEDDVEELAGNSDAEASGNSTSA
ncbi:MAG TPA: hypothetical protein VM677_08410 [Actinokineospora sp.]|jgi:hypothetical protein|nr:hypothetical protein [Actinokineospora sp.]